MALIRVKESRGGAAHLVCKVSRGAADLLVYVVNSRGAAQGDEYWFYVESDVWATSKIVWVQDRQEADLWVSFVDSRGAAGWLGDHPLKGKL